MDDDMSLGRDDIERALGRKPFTQATGVVSVADGESISVALLDEDGQPKSMEKLEREIMDITLAASGHNITKAAQMLGIAKSTFYRKMAQDTAP
ncbi:MAG: helix-turn-helix domain-containing protein [Alphaproteobacteria bacterium]|nr:helix-turn-helix domain-containing protein [Alphaproteobacteria bacterium]